MPNNKNYLQLFKEDLLSKIENDDTLTDGDKLVFRTKVRSCFIDILDEMANDVKKDMINVGSNQ
jgi:hypothetical protein